MRKILLAALLAASCGPSRSEDVFPRYAILTTLGPESPMYRSVEWLAARRRAEIYRFGGFARDRDAVASWLRAAAPSYVAFVLRPEEIDANTQLDVLELACRLDPDPFPDFAYGYFVASDAGLLARQMTALEGAESRVEKRVLAASYLHFGAEATAETLQRLEWATGLPLRLLDVKAGDAAFLTKNAAALERSDLLLLSGPGTAEGIAGFSALDAGRLKLDALALFSAADHTGTAGAVFEAEGGLLRRRTVRPEASFLMTLLRSGVPAAFAPLQQTHPALVGEEWTHALLNDAPFGEVMKHTYDLAILSTGAAPSFDRFEEGRPPSGSSGRSVAVAANRVLYGDPMLRMFTRKTVPPVRQIRASESADAQGRRQLHLRYQVDAPDCRPFFNDPFGGAQKIHLRIPVPQDAAALAALEGAWIGETAHPAKLAAQAVEDWRGERFLHVLVHGSDLARKDLAFQVRVTLP